MRTCRPWVTYCRLLVQMRSPFRTAEAFWVALQRALLVYNTDATAWAKLRHNGMTADFSWVGAARSYEQLYEVAISRARRTRG